MNNVCQCFLSENNQTIRSVFIWRSTVYIWQALWLIYNLTMICRHIDDENLYQYPPILTPLFHVFVILNFSANITWLFVWDREKLGAAYGVLLVVPLSLYGALIISHYNLFKATSILKRNNKYLYIIVTIVFSILLFFFWNCLFLRVDLWLVRILVHNGLAYYASWVTIAANLNLAIALTYEWKVLDNEKNSLIALGVVAFVSFWFDFESTFSKFNIYFQNFFVPTRYFWFISLRIWYFLRNTRATLGHHIFYSLLHFQVNSSVLFDLIFFFTYWIEFSYQKVCSQNYCQIKNTMFQSRRVCSQWFWFRLLASCFWSRYHSLYTEPTEIAGIN
jgi:hypothetical protein